MTPDAQLTDKPEHRYSRLVRVLLECGPITRAEMIAISICGAAFALLFCSILITHLTTAGTFSDWDFWLTLEWVADRSARHYHQIPQWSPYNCGGSALIGNPASNVFTPWFIFTLLFGPVVGLHLAVVVHSAIAWAGGFVLGRVLKMSRLGAAFTATTYAGSSWFFLHTGEGHISFLPFAYLPWILAGGWAAAISPRKLRYTIMSGALIALSFFEAGPYAPLFEVLSLGLILPIVAIMKLSVRPIAVLLLVGVFTAGFASLKYLPSSQVVGAHPRPTDPGYTNSMAALEAALFSRDQDHNRYSLGNWGFWETGAYLGIFSIVGLLGLCSPRRAIPWLIAAVILFELARGWTSPNCLWVWLHQLPVFSSTRLPGRLLIPFTLIIGVLSGIGISELCAIRPNVTIPIALVLLIVGTADLYVVGTPNLGYALEGVPLEQTWDKDFRQFEMEPAGCMFKVVQRNRGIINCYDALTWNSNARPYNEPAYPGEYHLLGSGSVKNTGWSPNSLQFVIDTPKDTALIINQNFDTSWRITSGSGDLFPSDGLLAVHVAAGKSEIHLRYVSVALIAGAAIGLLTTLAAILFYRKEASLDSKLHVGKSSSLTADHVHDIVEIQIERPASQS